LFINFIIRAINLLFVLSHVLTLHYALQLASLYTRILYIVWR